MPARPAHRETGFTAAVLTGGRSSRMGTDKAFVEVDGVPLAERARQVLVDAGASVVHAVGGDAVRLDGLGLVPVPDQHPGEGPLGGVLSALGAATDDLVVVLACDQPDVDVAMVTALVEAARSHPADVCVVAAGDAVEPFPAVFRRAAGETLQALFETGERSMRGALAHLVVHRVVVSSTGALADLDSPDDLRRYAAPSVPSARMPTTDPTDRARSRRRTVDVPEIDVEALGPRHAAGAAVLDVRQPDEYREAHVPGSRLIPLGELPERVGEVEAGGEVYVICRSGNRSRKAAQYLRQHGIDATNVAGGILAWVQAGKPTTSGDQPA